MGVFLGIESEHMTRVSFTSGQKPLFSPDGKRLYLTSKERHSFMIAADALPREHRSLCYVLAMTGCRISEALALPSDQIDFGARAIGFKSLKKREKIEHRFVPVPSTLLDMLVLVHDLKRIRPPKPAPLWSIGRTRAWQIVKATMHAAKIKGKHATPKGLRHGFGVHAVSSGVPLNLLQRWLGHAQLETTAIYANALGAEEYSIAARMWEALNDED